MTPSPPPASTEAAAAGDLAELRRHLAVLEVVLGESTDPIFNILEDGTYRYVNRAFSGPFGRSPEEVIGRRVWDLFSADEAEKRMRVVRQAFATKESIVFDVRVPTAAGDSFYITSVKPILDAAGEVSSVVCISKNITERKREEQQRLDLIQHLQAALQQVNTLSGLLPVCAHCRKVREDDGSWTQLEVFIQARSQAEFTHGVCPDCTREHFPESL